MNIAVNINIPVRLMCVSCGVEIMSLTNSPLCQCPKCGFKIRIEQGIHPAGLPGKAGPAGPTIDPREAGRRRVAEIMRRKARVD